MLVWLSFRGANLEKIWQYAASADWSFLLFLCLSSLLSNVLRAMRWLILLKPIAQKKVSMWNAFCAIVYGYAINVAIPRGGEVARLISITKTENLPWAGVLSTLLIDRLLDVVLLMLLLGSTLTILPPSLTKAMPWLLPGGATLSALTVIALLALPFMGKIIARFIAWSPVQKLIPAKIERALQQLTEQFNEGTKSLTNPITYPAIAVLSFAIWFLYWLNFYFVVLAFRLTNQVTVLNSFIAFAVGSVSVLVPTPGSFGSVHLLISQAMMLISGLDKDVALAYATVLHAVAFVLVPCSTAVLCLLVNFFLRKKA